MLSELHSRVNNIIIEGKLSPESNSALKKDRAFEYFSIKIFDFVKMIEIFSFYMKTEGPILQQKTFHVLYPSP